MISMEEFCSFDYEFVSDEYSSIWQLKNCILQNSHEAGVSAIFIANGSISSTLLKICFTVTGFT